MAEKPDKKLSSREVTKDNVLEFVNRELIPLVEKIRIALGDTMDRYSSGPGDPEGSVIAAFPAVRVRTDGAPGTQVYLKVSGIGSTGWTAVL